jgi:hypothetical protein
MTFDRSNHYNFIENGFCPWHFQSLNILKLMIHIGTRIFILFFWIKNMHIIINNNRFRVFRMFEHHKNNVIIWRWNNCQLWVL